MYFLCERLRGSRRRAYPLFQSIPLNSLSKFSDNIVEREKPHTHPDPRIIHYISSDLHCRFIFSPPCQPIFHFQSFSHLFDAIFTIANAPTPKGLTPGALGPTRYAVDANSRVLFLSTASHLAMDLSKSIDLHWLEIISVSISCFWKL